MALIVCVVASGAIVAFYQWSLEQTLHVPPEAQTFEVRRGEHWGAVLARLHQQGVIADPWVAKVYLRQEDLGAALKRGEFELPATLTLPKLLQHLCSNQHIRYKLTLVEGTRFADALSLIAGQDKLEHDLAGLDAAAIWEKLKAEVPNAMSENWTHPEGILYPDTYYFRKGDTDFSLLKRAHQKLVNELERLWSAKAKGLPYKTPYEALIMASIVEKETGHPDERADIAGVFVRRLHKSMRLQTDPTVIYGLGDRYQGNITRAHLKEKTAYNTYRINGLPPTPIALAGSEAIHAALHPAEGKALYFVAKGDGSHQFSETIHQHNQAVRKFQLKRRSDYRSTHQVPKTSAN